MDSLHRELLTVENLQVDFSTAQGTVHTLRGVSLDIKTREILGIVGESGSGKSVTMMSVMNLLADNGRMTGGSIRLEGRELSTAGLKTKKERQQHEKRMRDIRGREIAMIFQDPMTYLNPVLKIGTQMTEGIRRHMKSSKREAWERSVHLLEQVGIANPERRMKQYPFEFSGGMRQRIIIAMALACDPKLIIADEPTTALDVTIQAQILSLFEKSVKEMSSSAIIITHDLGVVAEICDRLVIMYGGEIVERGTVEDIFYRTGHPYTRGLLDSIGKIEKERKPLNYIPGTPPNLLVRQRGCTFCSRCSEAMNICKEYRPEETVFAEGHACRCWLYCKDRAEEIIRRQDAEENAGQQADIPAAADHTGQPGNLRTGAQATDPGREEQI